MNRLIYIFFMFAVLGCIDQDIIKPMKYNRHGVDLSCNGHYKNGVLQKVFCFSLQRDTILKETYRNGLREGKSLMKYNDGSPQEIGQFKNGHQFDEWKVFYPNGTLKSYRYFQVKNDTSYMIYEKVYDLDGKLVTLRYPLKFRTNNAEINYKIGVPYQLFIELEFSEFDSLNSYGFIEESIGSSVKADTLMYEGNSLFIEFTPEYAGQHSIKGIYIEIDGSKNNADQGYGGEKEFEFNYIAK